jgi:hypothetical protein
MTTNMLSLPKGLDFQIIYTDGVFDQDATTLHNQSVVFDYTKELANDSEAMGKYIVEIRLAHGKEGVMVSAMPGAMLENELHDRMGSGPSNTDVELFKRNSIKIAANLPAFCVGAGKSGVRFPSTDELAALRIVKAAKKAARAAKKKEEKALIASLLAAEAARKAGAPPVVRA